MISRVEEEWRRISNQVRFILAVVSGELVVSNRPKSELLEALVSAGYDRMNKSADEEEDDDVSDSDLAKVSLSTTLYRSVPSCTSVPHSPSL